MNDHTDPDLESTIERSIQHRAKHLGSPAGRLDDVYARVDRRRARKRNIAVVGSLAVVGIGLGGIVALSGDPGDPAASQPVATSPDPGAVPDQMAAWRCRDQLEYWGPQDEVYFVACEQVSVPGDVAFLEYPPATAPATVPADRNAVRVDDVSIRRIPAGRLRSWTADDDGGSVQRGVSDEQRYVTEQQYVVVAGDSILSTAELFDIAPGVLANYNEWDDCLDHLLLAGELILIPPNARVVELRPPDGVPTRTTAP